MILFFLIFFLLDQKEAKSQVGRKPTAQPRPHRLPTLPPACFLGNCHRMNRNYFFERVSGKASVVSQIRSLRSIWDTTLAGGVDNAVFCVGFVRGLISGTFIQTAFLKKKNRLLF